MHARGPATEVLSHRLHGSRACESGLQINSYSPSLASKVPCCRYLQTSSGRLRVLLLLLLLLEIFCFSCFSSFLLRFEFEVGGAHNFQRPETNELKPYLMKSDLGTAPKLRAFGRSWGRWWLALSSMTQTLPGFFSRPALHCEPGADLLEAALAAVLLEDVPSGCCCCCCSMQA